MELEVGELYRVKHKNNSSRSKENAIALYEIDLKNMVAGSYKKSLSAGEIVLYIGHHVLDDFIHRDVILYKRTVYAIENVASYQPKAFFEKL